MTSAAEPENFQQAMDEALRALRDVKGREGLAAVLDLAETARRLSPDSAEPLFVLGLAATMLNDVGGAIQMLEQAHKLDPDGKEIVEHLAMLHGRAGNISESLYYTKLALTLDANPRFAPFTFADGLDFGKIAEGVGTASYYVDARYAFLLRYYDEAIKLCRSELRLRPQSVETLRMMGLALLELGQYEDAVAALESAARLAPRDAEGFVHLAEGLRRQGRVALALDCCREAVRLDPRSATAWSALLTMLAYLPADRWRTYPEEASAAIDALAPPPRPAPPPLVPAPKTFDVWRQKKIRIAYLIGESAMTRDFGFLDAVMAKHNRGQFYIHGYQQYSRPFTDTARLQKNTDDWRQVFNIDDETLALIVANDAIDVLIDLCGASPDGRPAFLARRPAPIQISWLGFPQGALPGTVDILVSDSSLTEFDRRDLPQIPLLKLGDASFAYSGLPVEIAKATEGTSPAETRGHVTFGGALDPARLAASAPLWAAALRAAPGSRLLLGREPMPDERTRERVQALFAAEGVADRIDFQETAQGASRLAGFYKSVDILLDTLPVSGAIETCEALALGIPAISCRGDRRVGMMGANILVMAECAEWAAEDSAQFAAVAAKLAGDIPALAALRKSLPEKVKKSRLLEGSLFVAVWEQALVQITEAVRARSGVQPA